jgi:hypothetical protein
MIPQPPVTWNRSSSRGHLTNMPYPLTKQANYINNSNKYIQYIKYISSSCDSKNTYIGLVSPCNANLDFLGAAGGEEDDVIHSIIVYCVPL